MKDKSGNSFWDKLRGKKPKGTESKYYNPLGLKIGQRLQIDDIEYYKKDLVVVKIVQYRNKIGSQEFFRVDYELRADRVSGGSVDLKMRLIPLDEPDKAVGLTHTVLLLHKFDSFEFAKEFKDIIEEGGLALPDEEDEPFARIHDVEEPYEYEVAKIQDENNDGKVEDDEVEHETMLVWDFWRETEINGVSKTEFLYVEMDNPTGWFDLWKGTDCSQLDITTW